MKRIGFILIGLLVGIVTLSQSKYSPSAQLFLSQNKPTEMKRSSSTPREYYIPATIRTTDCEALQEAGIIIGTHAGEWVTARVPINAWDKLGKIDGVEYIDAGKLSYPMLNRALPDIGYERVLQAKDMPYPYLGNGVIVGIVDIGFQWNHIAFRQADGSTRIAVAWNQNDTTGTPPEGYSYGTLLDSEERLFAAPPCSIESHATHVTSIATGSAFDKNPYGGVAREADLVLVEALHTAEGGIYNEGIIDGINFIFEYARSVGKPCVINLSIGGYFGAHDGTSPFDVMCDSLQGEGRLIVGAMGNLGEYRYHLGYDFTEQKKTFRTGFLASGSALPQADIWSEAPVRIAIEAYNSNDHTLYASTGWLLADSAYEEAVIERGEQEVLIQVANGYSDANRLYNTMLDMQSTTAITGLYFAIVVEGSEGRLDMWNNALSNQFDTMGHEGWINGDNHHSLMEVGGTGRRITSVGAYVTTDTLQVRTGEYSNHYNLLAAAPFSGRGNSRDGRMKPEIAAPGCIIVAALNEVQATHKGHFFYNMTAAEYLYDNQTYYYGANWGTSMASPIVTGTYALWLQAEPALTPEYAKETLRATAFRDEYTTAPTITGYGKINPYDGLCYLLDVGAIQNTQSISAMRLYPTIGNGRFTLLSSSNEAIAQLYLYNSTGMVVYKKELHNIRAGEPIAITLPTLSEGIYHVEIVGKDQYTMLRYIEKR